jgi:hypothetical protein
MPHHDSLSLPARADSGLWTLERRSVDLAQLSTETVNGVAILAEERGGRLAHERRGGRQTHGCRSCAFRLSARGINGDVVRSI